MNFQELTTSDDKKIYLNLDKVISMNYNHLTKTTQLWVSPIDAYAVKESIEEILKFVNDPLERGCKCG